MATLVRQVPYSVTEIVGDFSVLDTAVNKPVDGRAVLIQNTGAQPLYFNTETTATAANGYLVPANSIFPLLITCDGNISLISNATGTTAQLLFVKA